MSMKRGVVRMILMGMFFLFGEGENDSTFINQDVLDDHDDEFVIGSNSNEGEGDDEAVGESVSLGLNKGFCL